MQDATNFISRLTLTGERSWMDLYVSSTDIEPNLDFNKMSIVPKWRKMYSVSVENDKMLKLTVPKHTQLQVNIKTQVCKIQGIGSNVVC